MATLSLYFEDKPLRPDINNPGRERYLGPPDKYLQEAGQKEDELSPNFLKHGFTNLLLVSQAEECTNYQTVRDKSLGQVPNFANDPAKFLEDKVMNSLKKIKQESEKFKEINDAASKKKLEISKNAFKCFSLVGPQRRPEFKSFLEELGNGQIYV